MRCNTVRVDPRMIYFNVPANELTLSPRADIPVFSATPARYVQCSVCNSVWESEPPQGHVCYPPIDPRLAWGA